MHITIQPSAFQSSTTVRVHPADSPYDLVTLNVEEPGVWGRVTLTRDQWARVVAQLAAAGITAEAADEVTA